MGGALWGVPPWGQAGCPCHPEAHVAFAGLPAPVPLSSTLGPGSAWFRNPGQRAALGTTDALTRTADATSAGCPVKWTEGCVPHCAERTQKAWERFSGTTGPRAVSLEMTGQSRLEGGLALPLAARGLRRSWPPTLLWLISPCGSLSTGSGPLGHPAALLVPASSCTQASSHEPAMAGTSPADVSAVPAVPCRCHAAANQSSLSSDRVNRWQLTQGNICVRASLSLNLRSRQKDCDVEASLRTAVSKGLSSPARGFDPGHLPGLSPSDRLYTAPFSSP